MGSDGTGSRRSFLRWVTAVAGAVGGARVVRGDTDTGRFSLEPPKHRLVYQFNKADEDYQQHVTFSLGEMLRLFGDSIELVVVAFGPGIHILGKHPERPVPKVIRERVSSLAQYGVQFHACANTMKALDWTKDDLLSFATVVDAGAADLLRLQEKGFAYISW